MITRKSEWLASIKPILDRDEAKKDAAALAKELGDILEVKIDASPENLDELAKEFNAQLKTMGKQPIVFSEKTLSGIVSQFANAIAEGISQGIVNGAQAGMKESLQQLRSQQAKLKTEQARIQAELDKKIANKKKYDDLLDFDGESVHSLEIDGDVLEEAKKQYSEFLKIGRELNKIQKEQGVDSKEYVKALYDAEGKLHDLYKIRKTLQKLETPVPTGLKAAYGLLDPYTEQPKYEQKMEDAGKKPMLPFYETGVGNFVGDSWERYVESIRQGQKQLSNIDNQMSAIDAQIIDITKSIQASGDAVNVVVNNANNGLKTLDEIQAKYQELTGKFEFQNKQSLNAAINYKPHINKDGEISDGIITFAKNYTEAVASGDWVTEYKELLKFVRLYESYLKMGTKAQLNKIEAKNNPFTQLYNQLKPMAENAENMLKNVVNMMEGKPLVGMGGAEKEKPYDTSADAVNADKTAEATKATADEEARAREEAEKKAQADKESEEANRKAREEAEAKAKADAEAEKLARQKREEEERLAKAAEKKKLADEAAIEARKEELGLMQAMEKFQGEFEKTDKKNETLAFVNTKTGDMSDLVVGDTHGVTMGAGTSRKMSERGYDMEVHSHSWKTAAPSVEDFEEWFRQLEYIKKFGIRAGEELLAFDFSNLDPSKLLEIIDKYADLDEKISSQIKSMRLDEQLSKFGSYQGRQEGVQTMLRQGLEEIFKDIPGVMKSIKMPELPVANVYNEPQAIDKSLKTGSLTDEFARANEELKELIKNYAILTKNRDNLSDSEYDELVAIGDKIEAVAPNLLDIPADQWQSFDENIIVAEKAVDELNKGLEKTQQLTSGGGTGSGTGDASLAELEAERAKSEALQDELDHRIGALQAAHDEKEMLQSNLNIANEQIKIAQDSEVAARARADEIDLKLIEKDKQIQDLEERLAQSQAVDGDELFAAEQRANEAEEKAQMYDRAMTSMQEEIADLRGKLAGAKAGGGEGSSASLEELKNVLSAIVYNVKIAHDDSDKTANKIAFDDSTLEATLTKVFANILNPQTRQNDLEQTEKHWALESTLQTVKGVLDNIHTNTTKIGTIKASNVDAIAGTALDGRLAEIKSVLESIDKKIAKGGVIAKKNNSSANKQGQYESANNKTGRATAIKSLISDYERLGKLRAQFENDGNLETKARLQNLAAEVETKRKSLKLTADEILGLREKSDLAYKAEQRLIDAAKAQKEIDDQRKAAAQNAKKQEKAAESTWKKQVKDAQRATGVNAATTAANAGDQTVLRAIGTEGVSKEIENKAKELSDQIKTLRMLRDEIDKKGEQASAKDRDNLSKQISKVKELKTEVDGYLKIHEKYSGEGVTDLGDASNFGAVGTDQYWNNITAAIKNASSGKTTIKGLNADTGELTGTTKIAANTFATWTATVDPLTGRLSMLRTGIKKTETLVEQITRKTKEIFTYFSGSSMIFKAVNEIKKGVQYIRDIDLALTELKKVTDETEETYRKFLNTASKTAAKVGSTIKDVVSSTADWARLGYSMEEAAKFAETTQILMNVSEFTDVSQATDTLISAVQAFGYTAETSMDVVDLLNTIGNNYAISTSDLAQSLTKSSASLVAAGGDLAEAAALTATANKIIQDADSVGTALKTTSLRLRGTDVKVLEEEGLDSEGAVTSKSKLQGKVKALSGVDILTATGEYKSTYEILRDISEVWSDMNDMDQAALLELIAGKRNSSVVAAILQNPKELKEAFEDANNAQGSALKENEKYLDSIQGKIDQFNNAVQTLWSNTLDSDVVKFLVDLATKLIKIVDSIGPLNIAIVGLVAFLEKKHSVFSNFFNPAGSGAEELTRQIDETFDPEKVKNSIRGKKGARTKRINQLQAEGKTFDEIQADPKVQQYTRDIEEAEQALDEYNATVQQTNATVRQASTTTQANTAVNQANAASNTASASAESADAAATSASTAAEVADTAATETHAAATWKDIWAEMTRTGATGASVLATLKQVIATKLASSALVQKGLAIMGVTAAEGASIPVTTMLAGGFVGLAASIWSAITAMWTFMTTTPIGWFLLAAAAIAGIAATVLAVTKSAEELREELTDLKSEISSIKNEIESLNGELETTQDRMAELLAKDSLTFTEQEELENLQKQNDLLEREIYLLEQREKRLQDDAQKAFDKLMGKETKEDGDGGISDSSLERKMKAYEKWAQKYEEAKQALVEAEKSGDKNAIKKAEKDLEKAEKKMDKKQDKVGEELDQYLEDAEGIDYESADEKTKKYLDYIYNTEGRYNTAGGDSKAKSVEIKRIFNKDAMSDVKEEIDALVKKLAKNPDDQNVIAQISEQCKLAESDLKAVGVSVQDATNYFTQLGSNASFDTIEGKVSEIQTAASRLQTLLSNTKSEDFTSLFDKDGKVLETAVAEYFKGTSEATRAEISKLVKNINEGKISVEDALKTFELFSVQSIIDIQVKEVQTNFKDVFSDLEDADGLIDTFKELGEAIGSTADAMKVFNQAQADVADKGFVSIQTALQLMEYTDDYGSVLQVVDGKLQLAANAEQNLIQARIDAIKVSAQTAVADAQAAYDKAELAVQSYRSAMVEEASASTVATAWQKIVAVAAGIKNALDNIFSGENIGDLYNAGYNTYLESATGYETSYDDAGLQALEDALADAEKKLTESKANSEIANAMTADNLENLFNPSDKSSPEEVADDAFQKEMDYWENRIAANQAKYEQLQNEIDLLEAKGQKADASYYKEQEKLEKQRLELLKGQKQAALDRLKVVEAAEGKGSENWWEIANTLNDIEGEIDDVTASIVDLQDTIGEIDVYRFEEFNTRLGNIVDKLGTVRDLIAPNGEEDWFDKEGSWTEAGVAVLGTHLQELETYKQGYQDTMDELAKYEPAYEGNEAYYETLGIHSEQEYYDKTEELISQQYDYAKSISDTEQSVVDMYESNIDAVEEYTQTLIDSYNDYIDGVKEALDAERDLYNFKKNVQKQTKNIADLERRIASLSGSTNASDIAERRRLEADLYGAREELDDTYYEHARDAQSEALDKEAEAYEESMNNFVEGLRTSLDQATTNMDEFLMGVTSMVMYNADTVLAKYEETNLPLTKELTNPWDEAKKATSSYSGNALELMNQWTKQGGFFSQFNATGTTSLSSPWSSGTTAANSFKTSVATVMSGVVSNISSNVKTASGELSKLYQQIQDTERRAANANVNTSGSSGGSGGYVAPQKKYYVTAFLDMGSRSLSVTKSDSNAAAAMSAAKIAILGEYEKVKGNSASAESAWLKSWRNKVKYTTQYYAKGTTGTKRDEFAITDEPQFGDELILVPGKDGNLSFMRKGTGVVPADLTANLMEWGRFTPDSMNLGGGVNVNMINNAVNKPEFNFTFDALVKAERIDENTLPEVKKFVQQEINNLVRQMNYAIKGKGGR